MILVIVSGRWVSEVEKRDHTLGKSEGRGYLPGGGCAMPIGMGGGVLSHGGSCKGSSLSG